MTSKKESILQLLTEGKNLEDLVLLGYNKKYIKEVIRNAKRHEKESSEKKSDQQEADDDIEQINWNNQVKQSKGENKKQTLLDLMKFLELLNSNEQLLNTISLEVKISINNKQQNQAGAEKISDEDILNPIEIYRDQGESKLRDILYQCDINVLKEIARRYMPDARGYVYKWSDNDKIVGYIIERAKCLSEKGSVFITE